MEAAHAWSINVIKYIVWINDCFLLTINITLSCLNLFLPILCNQFTVWKFNQTKLRLHLRGYYLLLCSIGFCFANFCATHLGIWRDTSHAPSGGKTAQNNTGQPTLGWHLLVGDFSLTGGKLEITTIQCTGWQLGIECLLVLIKQFLNSIGLQSFALVLFLKKIKYNRHLF